jgi:DNA invertase Pin-like site-specific DNA recombinase
VIRRKAIVYIRQSTNAQVKEHLESQRRQYDLVEVARAHGFSNVEVIDDDLGRSASGSVERPGFDQLVAELCSGKVGAVLCLEASRLSRNGRDWHHLLELCGLVEARVIDIDGVYNPCLPNDRLLLGMKGTISEFELGIMRGRLMEAVRAKARRGELRISVPIGFVWDRESGLGLDPDLRIQEVVRLVFRKYEELGSARQVHLWMRAEAVHFPRPSGGKLLTSFEWAPARYRNVISLLKNPFYAGVYSYGKSKAKTEVVDGRPRKSYGHLKPIDQWDVFLRDHHEGYISWEQFERNQEQLARNAFSKAAGVKSGRGGQALLAGLLTCGRCGRRLQVVYTGKTPAPKYRCQRAYVMLGLPRCMAFGAWRVDEAVAAAMIRAVEPMAIEAARKAEQMQQSQETERSRIVELELEQAQYDAQLAERRYAACDPDRRLIASQLEESWEEALQRVEACKGKLESHRKASVPTVDAEALEDLARDLDAAWRAPSTDMRTRQRLVRAIVEDIVADIDEDSGEIVLIVHWKGGQHTELRTRKPSSGEHRRTTSDEAVAVIRSMAGKWPDNHIAASLNRMGLRTGHDRSWNAARVSAYRQTHGISSYRRSDDDGDRLTMSEAASELGVSDHVIRQLIRDGLLPAQQLVEGAPYQIRIADLRSDGVRQALEQRKSPRRMSSDDQSSLFPDT